MNRVRFPEGKYVVRIEKGLYKVDVNTDECLLFAGKHTADGYGIVTIKVNGVRKNITAHRFMYMALVGEIPEGYALDHLCLITPCINVDHLEVVTISENSARTKDRALTCRNGHMLTEETKFYQQLRGQPVITVRCRDCVVARCLRYRKATAAANGKPFSENKKPTPRISPRQIELRKEIQSQLIVRFGSQNAAMNDTTTWKS